MGPRSEKQNFNSALNFRRVTHFWLCLLETQVRLNRLCDVIKDTKHCTLYTVFCSLYTVQCTLATVHCTLYTVYCILYFVHCPLSTVRSTPRRPSAWRRRCCWAGSRRSRWTWESSRGATSWRWTTPTLGTTPSSPARRRRSVLSCKLQKYVDSGTVWTVYYNEGNYLHWLASWLEKTKITILLTWTV